METQKRNRLNMPNARDVFQIVVFIVLVYIGTNLLNNFVFRSFTVVGRSMEKTFYTGDRLIANRLPVTQALLSNSSYIPNRNDIIVFKNPQYVAGTAEEYIVKRVIAFPGEKVLVKNGTITVYNKENPKGFNPNDSVKHGTPGSPVSGTFEGTVPEKTVFVVGDHREGNYSCDSRGCLGYIDFYNIIGPVTMRIWPFDKISLY